MFLGLLYFFTVKYMEEKRNICQFLIKFVVLSGTQNLIFVFKKCDNIPYSLSDG
jgi:hypothetical protein